MNNVLGEGGPCRKSIQPWHLQVSRRAAVQSSAAASARQAGQAVASFPVGDRLTSITVDFLAAFALVLLPSFLIARRGAGSGAKRS